AVIRISILLFGFVETANSAVANASDLPAPQLMNFNDLFIFNLHACIYLSSWLFCGSLASSIFAPRRSDSKGNLASEQVGIVPLIQVLSASIRTTCPFEVRISYVFGKSWNSKLVPLVCCTQGSNCWSFDWCTDHARDAR